METVKLVLIDASKELENQKYVKYSFGVSNNGNKEMYLVDDSGVQTSKEYHYEIGSITKLFTGLLISKAIVEGLVNLDDKVSKYLELNINSDYPTIEELITHTAGIELEDLEEYLPKENPLKDMTLDTVIEELNKYERTKDKYSFSYSNLGAAIIGMVLEKVNKKPYHVQVDELIEEIGLKNTYCLNPIRDLEGVNEKGEKFGNWDWLETSAFNAAGCMVSTLSDMIKFGEFIVNSKEPYVKHMKTTRYKEDYKGSKLEVGSFILKYPEYDMLYHDGGTGCFHSALCMNPNGLVVVALSNKYLDITGNTFKYAHNINEEIK